MVAVPHRQDLVGLAIRRGQQDGRVVGLGTRRGQEHPRIGDARQSGDPLGEGDHRLARYSVEVCITLPACSLHRRGDRRVVVADHGGEHAAEEVEVAIVVLIEDVTALAAIDRDRLGVIRTQERWQSLAVPAWSSAAVSLATPGLADLPYDVGPTIAVERPLGANLGDHVEIEITDDELGVWSDAVLSTNCPRGLAK